MRLVKASERHLTTVTLLQHKPKQTCIGKLLFGVDTEAGRPVDPISLPGRIAFGRCLIDFENEVPTFGQKLKALDFGDVIYRGVFAVSHVEDSVYECSVDCIEEKKYGTHLG